MREDKLFLGSAEGYHWATQMAKKKVKISASDAIRQTYLSFLSSFGEVRKYRSGKTKLFDALC